MEYTPPYGSPRSFLPTPYRPPWAPPYVPPSGRQYGYSPNSLLPVPPPPPPPFDLSLSAPPALAPQVSITKVLKNSDLHQLLTIEAIMVVAIIMSCIMLLGSIRKRTSNAFVQLFLWVTVVLTPMFLSYCLGQMTINVYKSKFLPKELFFIWGTLLLSGVASYGTISAFELEDNETALASHLQGYLKCGFVFGMLLGESQIPAYSQWFLLLLVPLLLQGLAIRGLSLAVASKSNLSSGVGSWAEIVAEYMKFDVQKTLLRDQEAATTDPKSMDGYRYLVGIKYLESKNYKCLPPSYHRDFTNVEQDTVTTQDIWQCEGDLLSSTGGDPEGRLKDTCLSFALFWMLLRRYIGYPLVEVTSLERTTWNFVRYGLMPDISVATYERSFRVIEQELSFLFDYFYTKNFIMYLCGTRMMLFRLMSMVVFLFFAESILKNHKTTILVVVLRPIEIDKLITRVVIYTMFIFELILMVHHLFITNWSRVEWVCIYVRKKLWRSQSWKDICLRCAIEKICSYSLSKNVTHWKREIGQYSLISSHDYFAPIYYFSELISFIIPSTILDIPKWGRKASKPIPFSDNLKKAVISSLHTNGRQLTNGKSSLRNHAVETNFSWACNHDTHTQTILVWHIATSFCELSYLNRHPGNLDPDFMLVATSLSKYCAYLVVFVPELLPDQRNTSFNIINYVILEANEMFKGCSNIQRKYEKMRSLTGQHRDDEDPILYKGIWLGKSLVDRMGTRSLWQMLEEFWAELLLYLAPSDDVAAHVKHLANGGEFITHLWALLSHAGILKRD